jgi:hypothetical protein
MFFMICSFFSVQYKFCYLPVAGRDFFAGWPMSALIREQNKTAPGTSWQRTMRIPNAIRRPTRRPVPAGSGPPEAKPGVTVAIKVPTVIIVCFMASPFLLMVPLSRFALPYCISHAIGGHLLAVAVQTCIYYFLL